MTLCKGFAAPDHVLTNLARTCLAPADDGTWQGDVCGPHVAVRPYTSQQPANGAAPLMSQDSFAVQVDLEDAAPVLVPFVRSADVTAFVRAVDPSTPPDVLAVMWLGCRDDLLLASFVAEHPNLPVGSLALAAYDPEPLVRMSVAANRSCPAHLLAELCEDDDPQVRAAVARSSRCPDLVWDMLASDDDDAVRQAVAGNPAAPPRLRAFAGMG